MARTGELPHTPYYGSVDSTPLWLILLGATFDWTGDRELVDRLWPNALAALEWIDRYGDRDGDGFVEYERRSERGLLNQGWKDSERRHPGPDGGRGRRRRSPWPRSRATSSTPSGGWPTSPGCVARRTWRRGSRPRPRRWRARFEAAFWVEDQRYYAMALDRDKRQFDAIASNAGQCLWSGIVAPERARDVVDQLLRPSMFSGWGIRTLRRGPTGLQPDRLPHRAPSGRTTRR